LLVEACTILATESLVVNDYKGFPDYLKNYWLIKRLVNQINSKFGAILTKK